MRALLIAATALLIGAAPPTEPPVAATSPETTVKVFIDAYDRAFNAKDLTKLAAFYDPDVTIFEGGHVNNGWTDYRDNHLGPELKEMDDLHFAHLEVVPHLLSDGTAYVTAKYRLKTKVEGNLIDAEGLETLILGMGADARWKIRHAHTSSRRKPQAQPSAKP